MITFFSPIITSSYYLQEEQSMERIEIFITAKTYSSAWVHCQSPQKKDREVFQMYEQLCQNHVRSTLVWWDDDLSKGGCLVRFAYSSPNVVIRDTFQRIRCYSFHIFWAFRMVYKAMTQRWTARVSGSRRLPFETGGICCIKSKSNLVVDATGFVRWTFGSGFFGLTFRSLMRP
jgi:hypothetical protein